MPEPISHSQALIPPPGELRYLLAVAMREVDILRRLIRVAEHAARFERTTPMPVADRQGVAGA